MDSPAATSGGRGRARRSRDQDADGPRDRGSASPGDLALPSGPDLPPARSNPSRVGRVVVSTVDSSRLLLADRYWLEERIGEGSSSTIWRAWDELLARLVAVKVLSTSVAFDRDARWALRHDVRQVITLTHPGLVAVYDLAEAAGPRGENVTYVVTELLEGETIAERLRRGPLPWREAARICVTLASALALAHEAGITHRDIRADRIFLSDSGPKLIGLGLNRARAAEGSWPDPVTPEFGDAAWADAAYPAHAMPERRRRAARQPNPPADPSATDIFALGAVLVEMLTAQPAGQAPLPREVPDDILELCRRCLSRDPSARPTAVELAELLKTAPARARRSGKARTPAALTASGYERTWSDRSRSAWTGLFARLSRLRSGPGTPTVPQALPAGGLADAAGGPVDAAPARVTHARRNMIIGGSLLALGLVSVFISVDSSQAENPSYALTGPRATAPSIPWLTAVPSPSPTTADVGGRGSGVVPGPTTSSASEHSPSPTPTSTRPPVRPPVGGGGRPRPPGGGGQQPAGPPSRDQTLGTLSSMRGAVNDGQRVGEIRGDVALDLNNVINSLWNDVAAGRVTDPRPRAWEIREKISRRLGESSLSPRQADRLISILSPIL